MPKMSYDMQQGTVVRWLKDEGEQIVSGEVIAEIETDKATVEMPAYINGVMGRIVVETGRTVPVGELIAIITQQGETLPPLTMQYTEEASPAQGSSQSSEAIPLPAASSSVSSAPAGEVKASPIARRLARERGIDLTRVTGSGPGGRIVEADILSFQHGATPEAQPDAPPPAPSSEALGEMLAEAPTQASPADTPQPEAVPEAPVDTPSGAPAQVSAIAPAAPAAPQPVTVASAGSTAEPLSRMRQAIARVTSQSKHEAPHFYVTADIDMTLAMALRRQINESLDEGGHVTVNDMVVKAVAMTLKGPPSLQRLLQGRPSGASRGRQHRHSHCLERRADYRRRSRLPRPHPPPDRRGEPRLGATGRGWHPAS